MSRLLYLFLSLCLTSLLACGSTLAEGLRAGVAKVDITDYKVGTVHDPSFAKALVVSSESQTLVLVTLDAVAVGEIGRIGDGFLGNARRQLHKELGIDPASIIINASHCHGTVRQDSANLVVDAVKEAWNTRVPVKVGVGAGSEDRISENRRLKMKDGSEVDMRRAYSLPRDEDIASVGPIDPQIGLLRLDREDGRMIALVYSFACHPIMNPPYKGSSADYPAYASRVIEEAFGNGALAFFIQGCGGDINPVRYKEVTRPADAEPLGNLLGISVLHVAKRIQTTAQATIKVSREYLSLPRGQDIERRIAVIESERLKLFDSLKPTNINFKSFLPLLIQQRVSPNFPSHDAQSYLHDQSLGRDDLQRLDADNRAGVEAYLQNIQSMEKLTRLSANLVLLKKHLAKNKAAGKDTLEVEIMGLRLGDFKMVTFPGELTVQVGLDIKKAFNDPHTTVAGYTNGYIYYAPTLAQRNNTGYAQEDCDSLVAPEWQQLFETKALAILKNLTR